MTKSLRVLIIRNAYQQDAGGAEQYALNLAVALRQAGHKPILVTKVRKILEKSKRLGVTAVVGKWHDSQAWDRWYYLRYPFFSLWYVYLILRYRIDVVHPQSRDDFVFATRAASWLGKKVIWTDHADLKYVLDSINHFNPRMRRWVIAASKRARAITCASHAEQQAIKKVAPDLPPTTVVHNGVFLPQNVDPIAKTNKLVVGTNARLVENKGIGELIEGFAALKNKDVDLWLLGGVSGNKAKYQSLAKKLGIAKQVHIFDYINNPHNVVAAMDIFVHASYREAFSLAIIEAAMLTRPIIATKIGGTPEIINASCGILIEPKSPEAITQALQRLIKDPQLRQLLGEAAHKKAVAEFDFQKIVQQQILALYGAKT